MSDLEQVGIMTETQPWWRFPAGKAPPSKDPHKAARRKANKLARAQRRRNRT